MVSPMSEPTTPKAPSEVALDPVSRISEILFGLIMVLSFTCSMEVMDIGREDVREILIGAIGCNLAWGLIDAFFYLMNLVATRGREHQLIEDLSKQPHPEKARQLMLSVMPESIVADLSVDSVSDIREKLLKREVSGPVLLVGLSDFRAAFLIFGLVFLSTFPVAVPFLIINDPYTALRLSNLVALVLLFSLGPWLGRYAGQRAWLWGVAMTVVGMALVSMTIALGG